MKLLLVEDDMLLAESLCAALKHEGFVVHHAPHGKDALTMVASVHPDMLILDLGLPDMDGSQVLRKMRDARIKCPVLILTARDSLNDKVNLLDIGADDYMVKPFELPELLARLRVMSRRVGTAVSSAICIGDVCMNTSNHSVSVAEQSITIPRREYMTLKALMENAGRIQTKDALEDNLYGFGEEVASNAIEVHISNLRKKLPKDFIKTVRGVGYVISQSAEASH